MVNRRSSATGRAGRPDRSNGSSDSRNLFVGAGFLVVSLVVIAGLVFAGGENDSPTTTQTADRQAASTATTAATETPGSDRVVLPANTSVPTPTRDVAGAAVTVPAGSTAAATSGQPAATDEPEDVATDVPEPTDEPSVEQPTEPADPDIDEEPTAPPAVGDFGELPPAQIVSGGLARPLDLAYELAISLDDTPSTAPVYLLEWPDWTEDDVATLAANLGINGAVAGSSGLFRVVGDEGELYTSGPTVQYVNTAPSTGGELGSNAAAIETARAWIHAHGLITDDVDGGAVIGRDENAGRVVVTFKPAHPSPLLAFVPSATVTVGPGETIVEANVRWPAAYVGSDYGLRSGDELWNEVLGGEGAVDADLSGVEGSGTLTGTLTIDSVSIAYSYAGSFGGDEFLVPLIVFAGEAVLDESEAIVPVSIYVPAVYAQSAPRG